MPARCGSKGAKEEGGGGVLLGLGPWPEQLV